jgi:hypothetical protein
MNRDVRNPEAQIRNSKSEIRNPDSAVDELLVSFFGSEIPQPWPEFSGRSMIEDGGLRIEIQGSEMEDRTIEPVTLNRHSSTMDPRSSSLNPPSSILHPRTSSRSRWVLAASIAILLIGSWLLGQRFAAVESTPSPTSSGKMIGSRPQPDKNKPPRHLSKRVAP